MRLIIPIILIALMLPYATGEDAPTGDWLIPPDPTMGVVINAAVINAAGAVCANDDDVDDVRRASTQPATQPTPVPIVRPSRGL